jgi:hypothetical protein
MMEMRVEAADDVVDEVFVVHRSRSAMTIMREK